MKNETKKKKDTTSNFGDMSADKSLNHIANMEAGTDIIIEGDALVKEAALYNGQTQNDTQNQGVTDRAPYKNIAKYKMIAGEFGEDLDKDGVQDNQGS